MATVSLEGVVKGGAPKSASGLVKGAFHHAVDVVRPYYLMFRYPNESGQAIVDFKNDILNMPRDLPNYVTGNPVDANMRASHALAFGDSLGLVTSYLGAANFGRLDFLDGFADNRFAQGAAGGFLAGEGATLASFVLVYAGLNILSSRKDSKSSLLILKEGASASKHTVLASVGSFAVIDLSIIAAMTYAGVSPAVSALVGGVLGGLAHAVTSKVALHHSDVYAKDKLF